MNILVTGVAHYLGSAIATFLSQEGYHVIPYSFTQSKSLESICKKHTIQVIIYTDATLSSIHALLQCIVSCHIPYFLICSNADVYGIPMTDYVEEKQKRTPITRFGKHMAELEAIVEAFSTQYTSVTIAILRLFMITGADTTRGIGPLYPDNTDFMVRLMHSFANHKKQFVFYGNDYATPDGYPIRDFIHIIDVCEVIQRVIEHMPTNITPYIEYNIGSGKGYSLSDVVNRASEVLQMRIYTTVHNRKEDEVARLVADISRAKLLLDWTPRYPLDQCILTTWHWCMRQG